MKKCGTLLRPDLNGKQFISVNCKEHHHENSIHFFLFGPLLLLQRMTDANMSISLLNDEKTN